MSLFFKIALTLIAIQHLLFLYLEMFAWETAGKTVFKGAMPKELFKPTKQLAANQGLYNGFLAAGLIWSVFIQTPTWSVNVGLFFLSCVVVAGMYGGYSVSKKIFVVQAIPALVVLLLLVYSIT